MDDVIISAQMSDSELLSSIDQTLKRSETKFNEFAKQINTTLGTIGTNIGQSMANSFNGQMDSMIAKVRELSAQMDKVGGKQIGAGATSLNINDYNNVIGGLQNQDFELLQLNEHYKQLEISSKRAFDTQKEAIKEQGPDGLQNQDFELLQLNEHYKQLEISSKRALQAQTKALNEQRNAMKMDISTASKMPTNNLDEVNAKLKRLQDIKAKISSSVSPLLNPAEIQGVDTKISNLTRKIEILQAKIKQPLTMGNVLGMSESNLNDISAKMRAISSLRGNYGTGDTELSRLNQEYQRLGKAQKDALAQGIKLEKQNNKLAKSFENLTRRVVYYAGLGLLSGFATQIVNIRAQFEIAERSMGALLNSFDKGSEIFKEIQANALKSPFTILDLETSAKQLIAYNFSANEVVETTKRLADISSALGVPMERIVYNLGQIKAKGVLDARDARDFANAGLAIVPVLAKVFTEQKRMGDKVVTTSDVYDMMTKKMVTYGDVMNVINKLTNDGGMFFDFQAKQAETLKGQLSNLIDAFNLMLNDIGKDQTGVLTGTISVIRQLISHWRDVVNILEVVIFTYGLYKSAALSAFAINIFDRITKTVIGLKDLALGVNAAGISLQGLKAIIVTNPIGALLTVVTAAAVAFGAFNDNVDETRDLSTKFGEQASVSIIKVQTLFTELSGLTKGTSTYNKVLEDLNGILSDYGMQAVREADSIEMVNKKRVEAIELIKQEGIERQRANLLETGAKDYASAIESAQQKAEQQLASAQTVNKFGYATSNKEIQQNATAVSAIIGNIIQENISLIANKTGKDYENGLNKIYAEIQSRMKAIGISQKTISQTWASSGLFLKSDIIGDYINSIQKAKEENERFTNAVNANAEIEKKAASSTLTYGEKVSALYKSFQKPNESVHELYTNIKNLMSQYSKNTIGFDIQIGGTFPSWMKGMKLDDLQKYAKSFSAAGAAIPKGGTTLMNGKKITKQEALQRGADYATAAEWAQEQADIWEAGRKQRAAEEKKRKAEEAKLARERAAEMRKQLSEEAKAVKDEIDLIDKLSSDYDKLTKSGISGAEAINLLNERYLDSIGNINNVLRKYKLPDFKISDFAGKNVQGQLDYLNKLKQSMKQANLDKLKPDAWKEVTAQITKLNIEVKTYDLSKITEGLQTQLSGIKDSYELGVEIDADPEMGNIFSSMFNIDTSTLPKTAREAVDKMQKAIDEAIKKYNQENKTQLSGFNILSTQTAGTGNYAQKENISEQSDFYKTLVSYQKEGQAMLQKEFGDTEKIMSDYVSKYGDISTKIQAIEKERLENIKKLNDFYNTDSLKSQQEYIDKLNAINTGAKRQEASTILDQFKNSDLYTKLFENLEYISSSTLTRLKTKLEELKKSMGELTPEQLKQVVEQENKIESEETRRNPFKILSRDLKDYINTRKNLKNIENNALNAQAEYDNQEKIVTSLRKKIEANNQNGAINSEENEKDKEQLTIEENILKVKKENLDTSGAQINAAELLMKKLGAQVSSSAAMAVKVSSGITSIRDDLKSVGVNFGDNINGAIDSFSKATEGFQMAAESLISGNVVGVVAGVTKMIIANGQMFASLFGGNKKDYFTGMKKSIDALAESMQNAQDHLTKLLETSSGTQALSYYQQIIKSNKELEDSYRGVAKAAGRSGSSWGSHSYAYRTNKALSSDWKEISAIVKKPISSIQDMYNLSSDELILIRDSMPDAWNKIDKGIRESLESVIKYGEASQEAMDELQKAVDGIDLSDLSSTFQDMFSNLDTTTQDWADKFESIVRSAIIRSVVYGEDLQAGIKSLLAEMTQDMLSGGELTKDEKDILHKKYMALVAKGKSEWEAAAEIAGVSMTSTSSLSSLQQGIQSMSETTGGALESSLNNISGETFKHTAQNEHLININNEILGTQSQMLLALQNGYQIQQSIQKLLSGWSSNNNRSVMVTLTK
jgi:hypothetical protein